MALRWAGVYVRARRVGEKRIFSPTQSFSRLMSSSRGRTALPPSHPHAATSDAAPPATPSVTNARRSSLGVCDSVTAREPPPVPAGEHRAERGGIHGEHEDHVGDREGDEDPHDPEVPVARRLEAAEQRREPGELHRLVDSQPGQNRECAEEVDARIGELLERVVFALWRVVRTEPEIVLRHVDRAAHVAWAEQQRAPLAALHEIAEVEQADGHEGPHQGEMPVQRAREPAAEAAPVRELRPVERAREEGATAVPEPGIRLVDLQPARDHPADQDQGRPVGKPHDPVVAAHRGARSGGRRVRGGGRAVAHRSNIFHAMKYVMLLGLGWVSACQARGGMRTAHPADSVDLAGFVPRDSSDSALLVPQVIAEPSVVLFWLRAADTLGADDRAQAFDDLKDYTEQVAAALQANGIRLLATHADTVYVALPNRELRPILLSGLDYPFGYLFIDPGGPERILTGVYASDDLMDELRAYFDISDDSTAVRPRITT